MNMIEQQSPEAVESDSGSINLDDFVQSLLQHSALEAASLLIARQPDLMVQVDLCRRLAKINKEFSLQVANSVFGDKLAGDLGARTTMHHPNTDYGDTHVTCLHER